MKVVVTGGAGFIGSNLVHELVRDHEVHVVDDLSTGNLANLPPQATFHRGSILDRALLDSVFRGAAWVFHQAALPSVARSIADPMRTHEANATGTLNVLAAARDAGVEKVVYAASSSAYGDTPTLPKVESMHGVPKSPYAVAKLAGEEYARVFHDVYGLRTTSLRYFNVYGPRQNPAGDYAAVIPRFIQAAMGGRPLVVHGDGEQSRDFTFVQDAVRANVLAAGSRKADGLVVNIGGGRRTTVNELAEKILRLVGSSSRLERVERRPGDVLHSLASLERAKATLGYEPQFSLDEGLKTTVAWFARPGA